MSHSITTRPPLPESPATGRDRMRPVRGRRSGRGRSRVDQFAGRPAVLGLLAATGLAGMLFSPVFGAFPTAVVTVPVLAVTASMYAGWEAAHRWSRFERYRPGVSTLIAGLAIVETTLHGTTRRGLPTAASIRALDEGVRKSWLLTLQSTWPARPEPRLVVFVPLLVLVAAVVGIQVANRTRARLLALVPSLVVAGLAQAYHPLPGREAVSVGLGYTVAAAAVIGASVGSNQRFAAAVAVIAIPVAGGFAVAGTTVDPASRSPYSLRADAPPVSAPTSVTSPLDEIAYRLEHPGPKLFTIHGPADADRWPLAVFDTFDGTNWGTDGRYRFLGGPLDVDATHVRTSTQTAAIQLAGLPGPWLPGHRGLRNLSGVAPLVDESTGTLLYTEMRPGIRYTMRWAAPDLSGNALAHAKLVPNALGPAAKLGAVPNGIVALARSAVGNRRPSFPTALVLERYLREHYRLAVGKSLPAGHGWPQIVHFLDGAADSAAGREGGTSEQFATAYVALARVVGIPARLVVGFRQPQPQPDGSVVVRNADILAWPEIPVQGVGWVPLDPSGSARDTGSSPDATALAKATDEARAQLPPPGNHEKHRAKPPRHQPAAAPLTVHVHHASHGWPGIAVGVLVLAGIAGWLIVIPSAKEVRSAARRRRTGNAAVVAAWLETRDRLRDHGLVVERSMTIRDVGWVSQELIGRPAQHAIEQLSSLVDLVLWSGGLANGRTIDDAWRACDTVRHGLARRPISERLAAALRIRGLRSPR